MNKKNKAIGIDLGTTNSCIAHIDGDDIIILKNEDDSNITASCIAFEKDKNGTGVISFIGEAAKRQAYANPQHTIYVFKRFMGKKFNEVSDLINNVSYKVVEGKDGDACFNIFGKAESPVYISSLFLQKFVNQVKKRDGADVIKDVVITVPANFNDDQRLATKKAGEIAGLNVLRIINEPTAAAMAYGMKNKDLKGKVLVYDLGGGTFDVTLLDINDGFFNVLGTDGDMNLGGEDFDNILYQVIMEDFEKKNKGMTLTDPVTLYRVRNEAKNVKELLSKSISAKASIPFVGPGPVHVDTTINKSEFENKIRAMIMKTAQIAKSVIEKAGVSASEITRGILVGGSTRIPLVKEILEKEFNFIFYSDINPDEAVAIGAAYQASILTGQTDGLLLVDICPLALGIETAGGAMTNIIAAGARLPASHSKMFTTAVDNQDVIEVKVYQGGRARACDNRFLGTLIVENIKPAPRHVPQIKINLGVDVDGIVQLAVEVDGKTHEKKIDKGVKLDESEVEKMKEEAIKQADADAKFTQEIELNNACDGLNYEIGKKIETIKDDKTKTNFNQRVSELNSNKNLSLEDKKKQLQELFNEIIKYINENQSDKENSKANSSQDSSSNDDATTKDNSNSEQSSSKNTAENDVSDKDSKDKNT